MEADKPKKKNPLAGKKVSEEILLKRKLGRIKAAEDMAKKIKKSGIEKVDNELLNSIFQPMPLINQKNYYTDYLKKDDQINFLRNRKQLFAIKKSLKLAEKNKESSVSAANLDDIDDAEGDDDDDDAVFASSSVTAAATPAPSATPGAAAINSTDTAIADLESNPSYSEYRTSTLKSIVLHPGSRNLRLGLSTDVYPKTVPNVIAIPHDTENFEAKLRHMPPRDPNVEPEAGTSLFGESFLQSKSVVQKDFRERMRFYKRRVLPNSAETVRNFNKKVVSEQVLDMNDPYKVEWRNSKTEKARYLVGKAALELDGQSKYRLRWPIKNGRFNENPVDYKTPMDLIGDLQLIVESSVKENLGIEAKDFRNHNIVLVVPDLYDKCYIETWISLLLQMDFNAVSIIQEAVAATFGAGVSQACVVDIGAQTTTISCIDEGMIINDSRVSLDYGGDDVTRLFVKLLLDSKFPYSGINLNRTADWALADNLKEKFTTFQDANIAIQLYDFVKRIANEKTEKFQFKVFDEVMLAPMGIFYPEIFALHGDENIENDTEYEDLLENNGSNKAISKKYRHLLFPRPMDSYTGEPDNPTSLSQKLCLQNDLFTDQEDEKIVIEILSDLNSKNETETNMSNLNLKKNELTYEEELKVNSCKLDLAIIESITNACKVTKDMTSAKKFYENLLLVGGGSKTPALDLILTDRINIWRPRILSLTNIQDVLVKLNEEFVTKRDAALAAKPTDTEQKLSSEEERELITGVVYKSLPKIMEGVAQYGGNIEVLSPPRDIDPQILTWKGGSVFARLKIAQELWIQQGDWDLLGSRSLHYKALFSY